MWTYSQTHGILSASGGIEVGVGYSGTGAGRNNPAMQAVHDVGPLPEGFYLIGPAYEHPKLGPLTMNLIPDIDNQMFGRSDFRMHGDNATHDASEGCIVMEHGVRLRLSQSTDRRLQVIA